MFLMLGLLVTPSELVGIAGAASVIGLALIFAARPLAVAVCLLPFRFPLNEYLFISWVGLRGAVPIILAIFPLVAGVENARLFFNIAFFVVLISLILQGWTVAPAARLLGLEVPPGPEPVTRMNLDIPEHLEYELVSYLVAAGALVARRALRDIPFPGLAQVSAVARSGRMVAVSEQLVLAPGDLVYMVVLPEHIERLNRLFDPHTGPRGLEARSFFGDFEVTGDAGLEELEALYGLRFADKRPEDTDLAAYLKRRFHGRPVVGDRVAIGLSEFIVKNIADGRIAAVGFRLRRRGPRRGAR
jgi:cell volume regulation protein A